MTTTAHAKTEAASRPLVRHASRLRLAVFMTLSYLSYAAVNAFWHYLATGRWIQISIGQFRTDLAQPLSEFLYEPLGVLNHPWMILVGGLLLAVLIFVPIMVAVLYRLAFVTGLVLLAVLLGHAPVLALAVAVGAVIAARMPLRRSAPMIAVMAALAPVAAYLALSALSGMEQAAPLPLQRWVVAAPLIVAIVSAAVASALVLGLAKLVKYRPGVVWPVLMVFLAVPVVVFYLKVGPSELEYSLIARRIASAPSILQPQLLSKWGDAGELAGLNDKAVRVRLNDDLAKRRDDLIDSCRRFVSRHKNSRHAPAALWLAAQAVSLQVSDAALRSDPPVVTYTANWPLDQSAEAWQRLRLEYPGSPQAAIARWRSAELALRSAQPDEAYKLLKSAMGQTQAYLDEKPRKGAASEIFQAPAEAPSREYYIDALFEMRKLTWLIEQNQLLQDSKSAGGLAALMRINPNRPDCAQQISVLLDAQDTNYAQTSIGDNLMLAEAMASTDKYERAGKLRWLAWDSGDAAVEANYTLGQLVLREPVLMLEPWIEPPAAYFQRVTAAPESPWTQLAKDALKRISN